MTTSSEHLFMSLDQLGKASFSKIYLRTGYWQMQVHPDDTQDSLWAIQDCGPYGVWNLSEVDEPLPQEVPRGLCVVLLG